MKKLLFIPIIVILALANGCSEEEKASPEEQLTADTKKIEDYLSANDITTASTTVSGLHYVMTEEGTGDNPETGQVVSVHYTGKLLDGTKFDSSVDRGEPIVFTLGIGQVIPGWEEGIALFKKGGKGTIFLPSALAYGTTGSGGSIGPNEVLIFDIELVDFN